MSLRSKVVLFVIGVSVAFAGTSYAVQRWITLPGFAEVEHDEALDDLARCQHAIQHDTQFLSNSANDYAAWDDTYSFIENANEEYKSENLIPETFENLKLNLIAFIRKDGTLVWGEVRREAGKELVEATELLSSLANADHRLVVHPGPDSKTSGVMLTPLGPMLVGSAPVTTSNREGAVRGAVIMGRFLTDELIQEMAERTRVALSFSLLGQVAEADRPALERLLQGAASWIDASAPATLFGYVLVGDVFDQPALVLRADMPRSISIRGQSAAKIAAATSVGAGVLLVGIMWIVLSRMIIDPLTRVTSHAVRVGSQDDLRARLNMTGDDEIGVLARELDRMVDRLAESRAQLLTVAHDAGMSQVASNVLHNVGNVLNGVGVSTDALKNQLTQSEAGSLRIVSNMLSEHESDLGEFLTRNERGRRIPAFISAMAEQIGAEQQLMLKEVQSLSQAVEHIRHVVDLQQKHAKHKAFIESIEPETVVEEALSLCAESLARHHIEVERSYDRVDAVPLDKHRVLQVIVNLLTNAVQAIKDTGRGGGTIAIRLAHTRHDTGDELQLRFEDDGVGVEPENRERVFAFGFSTRPGGQGIGLHSAANLAREMGGSLKLAEQDSRRGAAFVLSLLLSRKETPV